MDGAAVHVDLGGYTYIGLEPSFRNSRTAGGNEGWIADRENHVLLESLNTDKPKCESWSAWHKRFPSSVDSPAAAQQSPAWRGSTKAPQAVLRGFMSPGGSSYGSRTLMEAKGEFWAFSLRIYRQPGVSTACLQLQDQFEADVNLVLFAAWLGVRGRLLDPAEMREASAAVAAWQCEIVARLRTLRRRLKEGPPPAPSAETEKLRAAIKSSELCAEQLEQQVLESWAKARLTTVPNVDPLRAASSNVLLALRCNRPDVTEAEVAGPINVIANAAVSSGGSG